MNSVAAHSSIADASKPNAVNDVDSIRRLLAQQPNWAPAHFAMAQALEQRCDLPGAIVCYQRTIEIKPHCVEAHENLAELLVRLGQLGPARSHYETAAALAPNSHAIQNNLGTVLQDLGESEAAIECYERAITLAPDCIEAHVNLSAARIKLRQYQAAADGLRAALEIQVNSVELHNRLGHSLAALGRFDEAKHHYATAIHIRSDKPLWRLRLDLLGPTVFNSNAEIDDYQRLLAERLAGYRDQRLSISTDELANSNCQPPVALAYQGRDDLPIRRLHAEIFERSLATNPPRKGRGKPSIAFIVPNGSEGVFLRGMLRILAGLTPGRFQTAVVCSPSALTKFKTVLAESAIEYLPLLPTLSATIESIRSQCFDLAYFWEVGTDATSYFLPFFRLAAVQCTSWGWPVTSGIAAMDYFISSKLLEPAGGQSHYSERLIRTRHLPNDYPLPAWPAPKPDRERFGLRPEQHVYVCPQNPAKIQPDFDALAGDILRRDPSGVLLLVESRWPHVTEAIRARFARHFPDCIDQLRFVPRMIQADYLTLLATADVVLDTVHYSGGANSIYDALAVGTPVVTLPGSMHRGRYTLAAYRTMGVSGCIAGSPVAYVDLAVQLAGDSDRRRAVSNEITATRGALFDNRAAVRELEDLFEKLALEGRRSAAD